MQKKSESKQKKSNQLNYSANNVKNTPKTPSIANKKNNKSQKKPSIDHGISQFKEMMNNMTSERSTTLKREQKYSLYKENPNTTKQNRNGSVAQKKNVNNNQAHNNKANIVFKKDLFGVNQTITAKKGQQINTNGPTNIKTKQSYESVEGQRLQMLKIYLKEDTEKMTKLKKISDQHVISEMKLTQQKLKSKLNEAQDQSRALIARHQKQISQLKAEHESFNINQSKQIDNLRQTLKIERKKSNQLEQRLCKCLQDLQQAKKKQSMTFRQLQSTKNKKEEVTYTKSAIHNKDDQSKVEYLATIRALEKELSELEEKVAYFHNIKLQLQKQIAKHEHEKQYIKQNSEIVLKIIRSQLKSRQGITNEHENIGLHKSFQKEQNPEEQKKWWSLNFQGFFNQ